MLGRVSMNPSKHGVSDAHLRSQSFRSRKNTTGSGHRHPVPTFTDESKRRFIHSNDANPSSVIRMNELQHETRPIHVRFT